MLPLAIMLSGVLVFGERLRPAGWLTVTVAGVATAVLTAGYGRLPWIALTLCGLMAVYASLKKKAAAPALEGFAVECLTMAPPALGLVIWLVATGQDTVGHVSVGHSALVALSGLVTAVPLLGYAASLRRLPLATIGVLQYVNPIGQFLLGVLVRHEDMSSTRWTGFTLAWTAIFVFVLDSLIRRQSSNH